ncbi:MAG: DUF3089 domain-containing protein [Alphaproteobacteria bacterium]|nr:DUF3089 domain-containing protein [Alphaproteobacteria bacterium]
MIRALLFLTPVVCLLGCGDATQNADRPAPTRPSGADLSGEAAIEPVTPLDYSAASAWLCRPGAGDACRPDLTATVVAADGSTRVEPFTALAEPAIDCFYVYPTVSLDETPNSDAAPGPEEAGAVQQQFARFGALCRLFAPVYRQVTLPALRAMMQGVAPPTNREMAYADVRAAWDHYLANDNAGRGVVLVGHSQGAGLLTRLIANEIDGEPVQDRLVSALLLGSNLAVPANGSGRGGAFQDIGLCVSDEDIGCAIAYASYRAETPPAEGALFGRVGQQGMRAACVNPAELDGSAGALGAYLPAGQAMAASLAPGPWTSADNVPIDTPFVVAPGLLTAQCVSANGYDYLAVTTNADPADPRTDAIVGDVVTNNKIQPGWGLHLIEANLAMGNLLAIVQSQAASYASREVSRNQHPETQ